MPYAETAERTEYLAARAALRKARRTGVGYPEARRRALAAERAYAPLFWQNPPAWVLPPRWIHSFGQSRHPFG